MSEDVETRNAVEQLERLQLVTDTALAYLTTEDLLGELLLRVRESLNADTAAILLLDESTNELVARAAKGLEEEVEQGVRIPVGGGFAGKIASEMRPVVIDRVDHRNVLNPILREKGVTSLLGVPLITQGRLLGVLHVGSLTPRTFTETDTEFLQTVSDRVALAIRVGMYERDRAFARTLQSSLLPGRLPSLSTLELEARYYPAGEGAVGGDWYDAFALPDGGVALAIGDVVGHGIPAAAAMGRFRSALRAYAFEGLPAPEVVERLNSMMRFFDPDEMSTLIFGVFDARTRALTFVNAGHLPPIIRHPGNQPEFVNGPVLPPLGAVDPGRPSAHDVQLQPGSVVLLYTDGLVERRGTSLDAALEKLLRVVAEDAPVDVLVNDIVTRFDAANAEDDVALLAVRVSPNVGGPFNTIVEASPARLADIRGMLRIWLADLGIPSDIVYDVLVATGEAATNAIEHAYSVDAGEIDVTVTLLREELEVIVRDKGRWRDPRGADRGRGITMMRNLASSVDISRRDEGTEVTLRWRLGEEQS